jgi:hypothetical protein
VWSCKYGGLIVLRHDEVTRELIELGTLALRPGRTFNHPSPETATDSDQQSQFNNQSAG